MISFLGTGAVISVFQAILRQGPLPPQPVNDNLGVKSPKLSCLLWSGRRTTRPKQNLYDFLSSNKQLSKTLPEQN